MNNEVSILESFFSDLEAFIEEVQARESEEEIEKKIKDGTKKLGEKYGITIEIDDNEEIYEIFEKLIIKVIAENRKDENIVDLLDKIPEVIKSDVEANVIKNLNDDDKVAILDTLQKESYRANIIKTIENDEIKLKLIKTLKTPMLIAETMETIKDDSLKIKNLIMFQNLEYDEGNFTESPDYYKAKVVKTIKDDGLKIKVLKEEIREENLKKEVIKTIKDDELKINLLKKELSDESLKAEAITTIQDTSLKIKIVREELLDENLKSSVIGDIPQEEILKLLQSEVFDDETKVFVLKKYEQSRSDKVYEILEKIEEGKIAVLKRLYQKNNDVLQNIDVRILDNKYLRTLGEEKINLITCYPEIQKQILGLKENELEIFSKCIQDYLERGETDEWTPVAEYLLENIMDGQYSELIQNIEDLDNVDIDKLSKILQLPNTFGLKTLEDIENYEQIKDEKLNEIINKEGDTEEKKNAVFLKLFGMDIEYSKDLIIKFGEDIENLEDCDEKDFILVLKEIMNLEDEDTLREIFNECDGVGLIDKTMQERNLKTAYGKKFNEGLYETKTKDIIDQKDLPEELRGLNLNVYDAGTDFRMIITSIAPYVQNQPQNFRKDWNRPAIASQHFCACYIRNDMLGVAPMPHLCYGFSEMKEDALMLSGNRDIVSTREGFVSKAQEDERYYTPDTQINKTTHYNEMDFRRIQGGEKKQPDYIVAFKQNGKIDNIDKILQGVNDWEGKLPIVIVDIDKCLESERGKLLGSDQEKRRNTNF